MTMITYYALSLVYGKGSIMPAGLQCFNADGKITVDLTDKHLELYRVLTVAEAVAPLTIAQYFAGGTAVPPTLTLLGIDPSNTLGFASIVQPGTQTTTVGMQKITVTITKANSYILNKFEDNPSGTDKIYFYRFR